MLRFAKLVHHPRKLYRMTGLTLDQFQTLTTRLTPLWAQAERTRLSQRKRKPRHRPRHQVQALHDGGQAPVRARFLSLHHH